MSGASLGHHRSLAVVRPKFLNNERTTRGQPKEIDEARHHLELCILQGAVAVVFFAAGAAKLTGAASMVDLFAQIGVGQWLRIATGLVEIVGAIALVTPGLGVFGALWLGFTMLCAVATHLLVLHTAPTPVATLGLLNALIVYVRSDELMVLVARIGR